MNKIRLGSMKLRAGLATALALSVLTGSAFAQEQDAGTNYIRYRENKQRQVGRLQIAKAVFQKPGDDKKVILYGVVHIADKAYYKKVQRDLDSYQVVLWEGVKPGKKKARPGVSDVLSESMRLRIFVNKILNLESQGKHINVRKPNFVWADVSMDFVNKEFEKEIPELPPIVIQGMKQLYKLIGKGLEMGSPAIAKFLDENPEIRYQIKTAMASGMNGSEEGGPKMMNALNKVILLRRNDAVMKVFHKEIAKDPKTLCIFYGAAHMPDFEQRLNKMGYRLVKKSWNNAWTIKGPRFQGSTGKKAKGKKAKVYRAKGKKRAKKSRNPKAKLY